MNSKATYLKWAFYFLAKALPNEPALPNESDRVMPAVYSWYDNNGTNNRCIDDRSDTTQRTNTIGNRRHARIDVPGTYLPSNGTGMPATGITNADRADKLRRGCKRARASSRCCCDFLSTGDICRCKSNEQSSGGTQTKQFSIHKHSPFKNKG